MSRSWKIITCIIVTIRVGCGNDTIPPYVQTTCNNMGGISYISSKTNSSTNG